VNSERAVQFRKWAVVIFKEYTIKAYAKSELEKYRIVQDLLFESDFDKVTKTMVKQTT